MISVYLSHVTSFKIRWSNVYERRNHSWMFTLWKVRFYFNRTEFIHAQHRPSLVSVHPRHLTMFDTFRSNVHGSCNHSLSLVLCKIQFRFGVTYLIHPKHLLLSNASSVHPKHFTSIDISHSNVHRRGSHPLTLALRNSVLKFIISRWKHERNDIPA